MNEFTGSKQHDQMACDPICRRMVPSSSSSDLEKSLAFQPGAKSRQKADYA